MANILNDNAMDKFIVLLRENIFWIILYAIAVTLAILIIAITKQNRKRKYMLWKKDTINLYVFKREWEFNEDKFIEELFSANESLTNENKLLKQKVNDLSIASLLLLLIVAFISKFKGKAK
ncbi:MAG: hypothetical protein NTZ69_10740 [Bacteroidia bacterium]|nr:hypothetical protein [Bacteroidia bacterium]